VRETAERSLAEKDGKALSQAVKKLKRELAARGLGEDAAWEHIFAFHDAVIAEIARIDGRAPPKGCVR
jgi:high-affinity K+ transport system ATPase subunit B